MAEIKAAYRNAGRVLKAAGCDGVQLHCCHNDVLSRMISPFFNQRNDQYGGSPENRARLVVETGKGDHISMCRPFIREPDFINRWSSGDTSPVTCISCDGCLKETMRSRKLRCVQITRPDGTPKNNLSRFMLGFEKAMRWSLQKVPIRCLRGACILLEAFWVMMPIRFNQKRRRSLCLSQERA
jgi:hypothetical protein